MTEKGFSDWPINRAKYYQRITLFIICLPVTINSVNAGWEYNGQNTLRAEHYDVKGEAGLYSFEGPQQTNDFNLNFSYIDSPYQSTRGYIQASSNNSDYRQPHGTVIHNAAVNYQTGETAIPLRLDLGDFYASQSRRTLQQGLKGLQVELQPTGFSTPQSVQLFWGRQASDYNAFTDGDKDFYWGASWLIEQTAAGSFAFTAVNYQNDNATNFDGIEKDLKEHVTSMAWEESFNVSSFSHSMEAEFAYLTGQNLSNDSISGTSEFLQLTGFGQSGQNYLLSYEKNSDEYTPKGSALYSDRQSINANWGQNLYGQLNINVRGQQYKDYLSTANPFTTQVYGLNLVGLPFANNDLNANFDLSLREVTDNDKTAKQDSWNARIDLSKPVNDQWRNRLSYQWQQNNDQINDNKNHRRTASIGADYTVPSQHWQTVISPSINYMEDVDINNIQQDNLSLGLSVNARSDNHSLLLSHQRINFETENPNGLDSATGQTRLQWRTNWQAHTFELNFDHYNFNREQQDDSDSMKASLAWTYNFSKPQNSAPIINREEISLTQFSYLDDLQLNSFYDESLESTLQKEAWSSSGRSGSYQLYEGKLLQTINDRQVLVLGRSGPTLTDANLLVPFSAMDSVTVERLYRKVLDELLKTYGPPSRERSFGDFDVGWQIAVNRNELIRIVEWRTANGILRFGLPRPRIGSIRLELQLKPSHPALDTTDWGLSLAL